MSIAALHPDNKIHYREGQAVEFTLNGDLNAIRTGIIRGFASENVIDFWIIEVDLPIPDWEYSCITLPHTLIRPRGDNRPFLSEGVSRT